MTWNNMVQIKCRRCGKPLISSDTVFTFGKEDEDVSYLCKNCCSLFGTCHACAHETCEFFNNSDPMPHMVMIQKQERTAVGVMIVQKQVPNPERIRKFCIEPGCACLNNSDPDHPFCCRHTQYTTCTNYCEKEL